MSTSSISLQTGVSKQLDTKTQAADSFTPADAADPDKLARVVARMLAGLAALQRRYAPSVVTFRDIVTTGTTPSPQTLTITHKLGGVVDWWPVRVRGLNPSATSPILVETASDGQVLTLLCYGTGTFDIRVQEAG